MTDRSKALSVLALITLAIFCVGWLLTPWADTVRLVLVCAISVPATIFAGFYMLTRPWWTTVIGCAMLVSSTGLALLVDISLLYQALGDNYALRDAVSITVFAWVFAGACFKCYALFAPERWRPSWLRFRGDSSLHSG